VERFKVEWTNVEDTKLMTSIRVSRTTDESTLIKLHLKWSSVLQRSGARMASDLTLHSDEIRKPVDC
jgi:hypothetical protein